MAGEQGLFLYPYATYLLYVVAVAGCCILLIRRGRRGRGSLLEPGIVETALLRGGRAAVVETLIFRLYARKQLEFKTDEAALILKAEISKGYSTEITQMEEEAVRAFAALQGSGPSLRSARRRMAECLVETEAGMQAAGWWKKRTRWHLSMNFFVPALIVAGSLRFLDRYDGWLQWVLALSVPVLAVAGRRIVSAEMYGPTSEGKELLGRLRRNKADEIDPVWQVALNGAQSVAGRQEFRLFCFMTRGIPYRKL